MVPTGSQPPAAMEDAGKLGHLIRGRRRGTAPYLEACSEVPVIAAMACRYKRLFLRSRKAAV